MTLQASSDKMAEIRKQVWNNLYDKEELTNPTLPYNIIPNFKSLDGAIDRLLELEGMKGKVLLSMEKCMSEIRLRVLQEKSTFYVMTYKTSTSTVCKVDCPPDHTKYTLRQTANLYDKDKCTMVEATEPFDVLIVSSIAVSPEGDRMGKSDTLGELEYPILSSLGFVGPNTLVVTVVHDLQVVDGIITATPNHPLPVDLIITPTRVIECEKRAKVGKIGWAGLKEDAINEFVVLRSIRHKEWTQGGDVRCIGQEDNPTEMEEVVARKGVERRRFRGSRKSSFNERKEGQKSDGRRRKMSGKENGENGEERRGGGGGGGYNGRRNRRFPGRQRRYFNSNRQFSNNEDFKPALYVGELPRDMTSEAFSDLLASKNVHPSSVVKNKDTTHAFAIFEKSEDVNTQLINLDGLSLEDKPLKIELSRQTVRRQQKSQPE